MCVLHVVLLSLCRFFEFSLIVKRLGMFHVHFCCSCFLQWYYSLLLPVIGNRSFCPHSCEYSFQPFHLFLYELCWFHFHFYMPCSPGDLFRSPFFIASLFPDLIFLVLVCNVLLRMYGLLLCYGSTVLERILSTWPFCLSH